MHHTLLFKEVKNLADEKDLKADEKDVKAKEADLKKDKKKPSKDKNKKNPIQQFFENLLAEFRKVIWPSKNDLIKQTIVVIIISLFMGALIFGMDALFNYLQTWITNLAKGGIG